MTRDSRNQKSGSFHVYPFFRLDYHYYLLCSSWCVHHKVQSVFSSCLTGHSSNFQVYQVSFPSPRPCIGPALQARDSSCSAIWWHPAMILIIVCDRKLRPEFSCRVLLPTTPSLKPLWLPLARALPTRTAKLFLRVSKPVIEFFFLGGAVTKSRSVKRWIVVYLCVCGCSLTMAHQEYFLFKDSEILAKIKEWKGCIDGASTKSWHGLCCATKVEYICYASNYFITYSFVIGLDATPLVA